MVMNTYIVSLSQIFPIDIAPLLKFRNNNPAPETEPESPIFLWKIRALAALTCTVVAIICDALNDAHFYLDYKFYAL